MHSTNMEYVIQMDTSIGDKIVRWSDLRIYEESRKDEAFDYFKQLIASRSSAGNINDIRFICRKIDIDETVVFNSSDQQDMSTHEALEELARLSQEMKLY